jgi:hypothetical protein
LKYLNYFTVNFFLRNAHLLRAETALMGCTAT